MSSHHIVRDEQEPALILASAKVLDVPWLGDLLAWSPVVLVLAPALDKALSLGFKIDLVLCAQSNLEEVETKVAHQFPIEVIESENVTIREALELLENRSHNAVNICTGIEQHLLAELNKLNSPLDLVFYDRGIRMVRSSNHLFEKWFKKGTVLEAWSHLQDDFKLINLKELPNHRYQVIQDGLASLIGVEDFWIQEPL